MSRHFWIVGQFGALQQINANLVAVAGVVLPPGELHKTSAAKGLTIARAEVAQVLAFVVKPVGMASRRRIPDRWMLINRFKPFAFRPDRG